MGITKQGIILDLRLCDLVMTWTPHFVYKPDFGDLHFKQLYLLGLI